MKFSPKGKLLDVGAGCGIVGLLIARDSKNITLDAVEKQTLFAQYARKNAELNSISYRLFQEDFLHLNEDNRYNYIVSNPPFYHSGAQKTTDMLTATARYNEHLPIDAFFKKVAKLLHPKGHFIFCYDASQFSSLCTALEFAKLRLCDVRFVHPKKDRNASLVLVHARNNSKSMAKIWPPLIHFDGDTITKEVDAIYNKANTESIKCQL
jgi:tRNA1(Val) A37 N6-methylase TrmN6